MPTMKERRFILLSSSVAGCFSLIYPLSPRMTARVILTFLSQRGSDGSFDIRHHFQALGGVGSARGDKHLKSSFVVAHDAQ